MEGIVLGTTGSQREETERSRFFLETQLVKVELFGVVIFGIIFGVVIFKKHLIKFLSASSEW